MRRKAEPMRQVWISRAGGPEVLEVREAPAPEAKAGEVRVQVKAAGINFADLMARAGTYPDAPKIPCVVGYEVSGVVEQVGAGVGGLAAGDRVLAMTHFGGYSDTVVVSAAQALKLPDNVSFEAGAALPVVYLTAHHILNFTGFVRPGSTVLIHSAAGGVGLAALDLLRGKGCVVFGTASASKHELLRKEGVQHPIDSGGDYLEAIRAVTGDRGVDLILDPVGGREWKRGFALLAPGGRLVCYGVSAMIGSRTRDLLALVSGAVRLPLWTPLGLMDQNKTVQGVNMAHLFGRQDLVRPQFEALVAMAGRGDLRPHVDRTFRFDEAAAAHAYLHDRKARGKVLLVP